MGFDKRNGKDPLRLQTHRRVTFGTCRLESSVLDPAAPQDRSLHIQDGSTKHATFNFKNTTLKPGPLADYLYIIKEVVIGPGSGLPFQKQRKPFVISVAGTPEDISQCFSLVDNFANRFYLDLLLEVDLTSSDDMNPQGSETEASWTSLLASYLDALEPVNDWYSQYAKVQTRVGFKIPVFKEQFQRGDLINTLLDHRVRAPYLEHHVSQLDFITVSEQNVPCSLSTTPVPPNGSVVETTADPSRHQSTLSDIQRLRTALDTHEVLKDIQIISVADVRDAEGYEQMSEAGAAAVAIAATSSKDALDVCTKIRMNAA
ncbi:MAG: dihydroorotate dehydrogenase [Pleopsidium flavum]|nr:MAG: dihydroorotate dehydrogenase [Pleopsidium flavum]